MNDRENRFEELISQQIDGNLSADEHQELQDWINADPEHAKRFAEYALLHDGLHHQLTGCFLQTSDLRTNIRVEPNISGFHWQRVQWLIGSVAAMLLVGLIIFELFKGSPALAAEVQLERLIAATQKSVDRTYLVTAIENRNRSDRRGGSRRGFQEQHPKKLDRQSKNRPPVDGAMLHVRGDDQYVLIRRFHNGEEFITGCDGKASWSIAPRKGRVRVSEDLNRFRGGMPGNQHSIPFINIHEDLENIRTAYELSWLDSNGANSIERMGLGCLVATKKSPEHRGPKYVEIWFDARSGIIHELFLDKLGRFKDGPESILLELIDESPLPEDFFQHTSHHDSVREVIHE